MSDHLVENSYVEGVGNELLVAMFTIVGLIVPVLALIFQRQLTHQHIHPESEVNVQAVRDEINQQRNSTQPQSGQPPTQQILRENHGQHDCPVCLDTAHYAIQTNCGHVFCGVCIVTYWQHGSWLGAVKCPVCRQVVTILLPIFTEEERSSSTEAKRTVVESINTYNGRFSGEPRPWMDYLRDVPTLLRHAMRELFTVGGLIWMFQFRVLCLAILVIVYFISPFDLLSEAVFGIFGLIDDLFIISLFMIYITLMYRRVVEDRANNAHVY